MHALLFVVALSVAQAPQLEKLWIVHEGNTILVEGIKEPNGNILWTPSTPFNRAALARPVVPNYGLGTPEQMARPLSRSAEAKRFIAEAKAEADTPQGSKIHLTIIGHDQDRAQVMADLEKHPAFAQIKEHLLVQGYKPDQWAVDPTNGFQVGGKPSIIAQQSKGPGDPKGGRVVYRALDYSMGPERLAEALTAEVRKVDPSYSPAKDPGPANASPGGDLPLGLTKEDAPLVGLFAVALIFLYRLPRKDG